MGTFWVRSFRLSSSPRSTGKVWGELVWCSSSHLKQLSIIYKDTLRTVGITKTSILRIKGERDWGRSGQRRKGTDLGAHFGWKWWDRAVSAASSTIFSFFWSNLSLYLFSKDALELFFDLFYFYEANFALMGFLLSPHITIVDYLY